MKRTYVNYRAALRAAQRKIGGKIVTVDGALLLEVVKNEQPLRQEYIDAEEACKRANIQFVEKIY